MVEHLKVEQWKRVGETVEHMMVEQWNLWFFVVEKHGGTVEHRWWNSKNI